jgi:Icc-related predicted phosphoesterase
MIIVSDVHDAPGALRRLVAFDEEIAILGDLVNLTDYRTGEGAVAAVMGQDFADETSAARGEGDYQRMRALWFDRARESGDDLRELIGNELSAQYQAAAEALSGGRGLVIHGNVDRPEGLQAALPPTFRYVHGEVVEREGLSVGFVGGGVETPLQASGEMSDETMKEVLSTMAGVDVLCTHVPPAVRALRRDVVTGREERGSEPLRLFLESSPPRFHFFGDVHQPQATIWRVGRTRCFNAGYFRATGRFLRLDDGKVHISAVG